jgi:hypothetical protein
MSLSACRREGLDYNNVQAQTGGPEQGEWRDLQGTLLSLNSGKFSYTKGGTTVKGSYKVADGSVLFAGDGGSSMTASFPDPNGPLTIEGVALTKTD